MPLFEPQRAFVHDPATFVTACCSRRAGKSEGAASRLLITGITKPQAPLLYFTLTRRDAKRIMWEKLLKLNHASGAGFEAAESELVLKRNGRARIYLTGCDNQTEIGKMRGSGWGDVVADESQLFPSYMKQLVEEVLTPSLMDFKGSIRLIGTPAPVPSGYFYDVCKSPKWSRHSWTAFDNPHVEARSLLTAALEMRGVQDADPSIQREFYGKWTYDPEALVFKYDPVRNARGAVPTGDWDAVLGVDLGFDDADAIAVIAFTQGRPEAYLREEHVLPKQTITQLATKLTALIAKYEPLAVVMDTGGLGKKIAEEIRMRYSLPIKAAEKADKFTHIELLNNAMRTGTFFAPADSRFAQDCMLVEWDRERSRGDKLVVSDRYHSDICDAVLYAFRESLHWLHEPNLAPPPDEEDELETLQEELYKQEQEPEGLPEWGG